MALPSGTRIGPYEILGPFGAGGMGEVYRARDTRLGRQVAIKFAAEKFSERFEREAQAVAALIRTSARCTTSGRARPDVFELYTTRRHPPDVVRLLRSYRDGLRANHANVAITWRPGFMVLCIITSSIGTPIQWCSRLGRWKTSWVLHCPLPRALMPLGGPTETEKLARLPITQRHGDWHIERPSRTLLRGTCCSNVSPDRLAASDVPLTLRCKSKRMLVLNATCPRLGR
jgi:hypothetical protein